MTTEGKLISRVHIPRQMGKGVIVRRDQRLKVIATKGPQIGDLFAFVLDALEETLSPSVTRSQLGKFNLEVGKPLYSNRRNPLLLLEEDTVGVHDLLGAACDPVRYVQDYGAKHRNCRENLIEAVQELGFDPPYLYSDPVNLFQNTPIVDLKGHKDFRASLAQPGDYALFRALQGLLVVVSACPSERSSPSKELMLEVYE